ncbi:hypothetical protein RFI_21421 [Reticulomyxa filosa]|uniref:Uncharacterized protein n=1 Tax=Reticulomyxa filosa TaxID=46433 RepID=X6MQM4_RETFI|nr:hypothetical protein RFI_21421 [Reticulomyxa filosa]|eukprot:ETO15941.1 hypothetical protein RFI_21421 [Reticulomyxa filosa]
MVVMEDIDALFNKDRSKKHNACPLTFTGLLNGLDGIGNPDGQIFILTTNFVDRLDSALIRSGRVDVHIHFPLATDQQLADMFALFYPKEAQSLAPKFIENLRKCFSQGLSMATVQQHFIMNMNASAEDVVVKALELSEKINVAAKLNEQSKISKEKTEKIKEQ